MKFGYPLHSLYYYLCDGLLEGGERERERVIEDKTHIICGCYASLCGANVDN
jgi:hypothetical protein